MRRDEVTHWINMMELEAHHEDLSHTRSNHFDSIATQARDQPPLVAMRSITAFVVCIFTSPASHPRTNDPLAL